MINHKNVSNLPRIIGIIALLSVVAYALFIWKAPSAPITELAEEAPIGPPTEEMSAYLQRNPTFDALIAFTERGFEPSALTIRSDQRVRFTNTTKRLLLIGEITSRNTPESPLIENCGDSPLGGCYALEAREFWEYDFFAPGTYRFMDNENPEVVVTIVVE